LNRQGAKSANARQKDNVKGLFLASPIKSSSDDEPRRDGSKDATADSPLSRQSGKIQNLIVREAESKYFGFITPDSGGENIWFGDRDLEDVALGMLSCGDAVSFEIGTNWNGTCAKRVRRESEARITRSLKLAGGALARSPNSRCGANFILRTPSSSQGLGLSPRRQVVRMSEQGWRGFLEAEGVEDWVVLHGGATAVFRVGSLGEAVRLAEAVAKTPGLEGSGALLTMSDGGLNLGYEPMADDNAVDPLGHGSTVWMQELHIAG
jgi:cold shock CspA family protein